MSQKMAILIVESHLTTNLLEYWKNKINSQKFNKMGPKKFTHEILYKLAIDVTLLKLNS